MIGDVYWATGVMLNPYDPDSNLWGVRIDFFDDGFCDRRSTEGSLGVPPYFKGGDGPVDIPTGVLRCRYVDEPLAAVRTLLTDAARLGITWSSPPHVYVPGDGEDADVAFPPDWKATVEAVERALEADPILSFRDLRARRVANG